MTSALIAGALANKAGNAGAAWTRLSWTLGMAEVGFDVHFVEQLATGAPPGADRWFRDVVGAFGLDGRATLLDVDGATITGLAPADLADLARDSAVLVNLSGHLTSDAVISAAPTKVFVDLDPGYTQLWDRDGSAPLAPHHHWYSVGSAVGRPTCDLPTGGRAWRAVRQPVVLSQWPVTATPVGAAFSTVASWRGPFGPVRYHDTWRGWEGARVPQAGDAARARRRAAGGRLDIDPVDGADRQAMVDNGWRVVEPARVAGTPAAFRGYVQGAAGELSVAQALYVHARTGWFGDRSTRFLASGRPVIVQDTGLSADLPVGEGLLVFDDLAGAAAALDEVAADPVHHATMARGRRRRALRRAARAEPVVRGGRRCAVTRCASWSPAWWPACPGTAARRGPSCSGCSDCAPSATTSSSSSPCPCSRLRSPPASTPRRRAPGSPGGPSRGPPQRRSACPGRTCSRSPRRPTWS
jgi:hypothetical protein